MAGLLSKTERAAAGAVLGGIAGYGRGLQESGRAKREMMMRRIESGERFLLEDQRHQNRLSALHEASNLKGQLEREKFTREAGKRPKGLLKDLGPILKEARAYAEISDEDGIKRLDEGRYRAFLQSAGLGKMADTLAKQAATGQGPFDPRLFEEAGRRAEAEAEDKAGYHSTDETDFADYGGSRERFKTERQREIYESFGGRGRAPSSEPATQAVSLDGMNQADARRKFDAMKDGDRFIRGGVVYEKRGDGAVVVKRLGPVPDYAAEFQATRRNQSDRF